MMGIHWGGLGNLESLPLYKQLLKYINNKNSNNVLTLSFAILF